MSEGKMDRRTFLKISGVAAGAAVVGMVELETKVVSNTFEWLTNLGKESSFSEIQNGTVISLGVGNEGKKNIHLFYANDDLSKLSNRQSKDVIPFSNGAETVRTLGEITEPVLKKVIGKNSSLPDNSIVSVYPTASGSQINSVGKQGLPEEEGIYALPVITKKIDYMQDESPVPSEKNMNASGILDVRNLKEFGQGLAIGRLDSENFIVLGYVCDARAVELG